MGLPDLSLDRVFRDENYPNLYSLLVVQGEQVRYERYFLNNDENSLFDIRSSFKSIVSLLTGIAIDKGYVASIDEPVFSYFSNSCYADLFDKEKKKISIRDLLAMKSGLACEEFFLSRDCETPMEESSDWIAFCLGVPLTQHPGKHWSYATCNAVIIGRLIESATQMRLAAFANEYFFQPLAITTYEWTLDPAGNYFAGGSFFMRTRDMLKVGQLVLNNGYYDHSQIISREYLDLATAKLTKIPHFSFVGQSGYKGAKHSPAYYGLYWYTEEIKVNQHLFTCHFTSGNGGQYILIIKDLDLVIACTQGNYDSKLAKQFFDILLKHIIPHFVH
jgi:CubicO group peptidase (beta-lactamase class C family)